MIIVINNLKWFWDHLEFSSNVGFVTTYMALKKFFLGGGSSYLFTQLFSKWRIIVLNVKPMSDYAN